MNSPVPPNQPRDEWDEWVSPQTASFEQQPGQGQQYPTQYGQQAQQPQQQVPPQQPQPQKCSKNGGIIALCAVLVLIAAGLGGYLLFSKGGNGGHSQAASSHARTTAAPSKSVVTETAKASAPAPSPSAPSTSEKKETVVKPPEGSSFVGNGSGYKVYKSGPTSDEFASAVAAAMGDKIDSSENTSVQVYSSVVGQDYDMKCTAYGTGNFHCTGGNNANVYLVKN